MTEQPVSRFNEHLVPIKNELGYAKEKLSEREWMTLMDILLRYCEHELEPPPLTLSYENILRYGGREVA